jgi:hypothetical protein
MSLAALADTRLQRTEAASSSASTDAKTKAGIPAGALNTLAQWVPTETLAGYVAIAGAMAELNPKPGQKLCQLNFSDRWQLYILMLVLTLALVPIYTKIKTNSSTTPFKWPVLEMLIAGVAFTLWTLALQDSAFNDWCGLKPWHSVAAIVIGTALLGGLTAMLKKSPAWSDAKNNNAPPSPGVN